MFRIIEKPALSLGVNLVKSLTNLSKKDNFEVYQNSLVEFSRYTPIEFSDKKLKNYHDLVGWSHEGIHPIFPYALNTHIHFALVNDKKFPFNPFGLVHKKEKIECFGPLKKGLWKMSAKVESINPIEKGYEVIIRTELEIDEKLSWVSTTTAFKKTKSGPSKLRCSESPIESNIEWVIPDGHGRKYAMVSHNIDPIHMSAPSAKMMGHKKGAIMHGMWTVGRGVSAYSKLKYPFTIDIKFISPIYMPATAFYHETDNGFGVYAADKLRPHLIAEIS